MPTVNSACFSQVLVVFAREVGAGPDKQVLLVLDTAAWHTSDHLQVPPGMTLVFLPPYSPELQPAERLWPLSNEPLLNRTFPSLDELEDLQCQRCCYLQSHPELIRSVTRFHWWTSIE